MCVCVWCMSLKWVCCLCVCLCGVVCVEGGRSGSGEGGVCMSCGVHGVCDNGVKWVVV